MHREARTDKCAGQRPVPFQPGATPQGFDPSCLRTDGPAHPKADDGAGLQPSLLIWDDAPGAVPQAGMGCAVGADEMLANVG